MIWKALSFSSNLVLPALPTSVRRGTILSLNPGKGSRPRGRAFRLRGLFAAGIAWAILAAAAHAQIVLTTTSISIQNSGGLGGNGASTSDMIYNQFNPSDGWGWAGGAGAVQGDAARTNTGGTTMPANEALKFNLGATVDALNATYGAGNWTIANPELTFASSYSVQNNSRFGIGSGNFDIYWVANDNWAQSHGTATASSAPNPIYASDEPTLYTWSGGDSLLGAETFTVPSGGSGYVDLSYNLAMDPSFVNDVLTASASGSNPATSLYLMSQSDSLGMIMFTGGQGQPLPTLTFQVVAVPEPGSLALLAAAVGGMAVFSRLRRRKAA
jgi:hypothetical protein